MSDADPVPDRFLHDYRFRAARMSLATVARRRLGSPDAVPAFMAALRKRWVWLAGKLRDADWSGATPAIRWGYMTHCPYFGVAMPSDPDRQAPLRFCRKYRVCPFCYARTYVCDAYDRLEPLLAGGRATLAVAEATAHAVLDADGQGEFEAAAGKCRRLVGSADRFREADAMGARTRGGAVVFHRVRVRGDRLTVVRTTLTAVPPGRAVVAPSYPGTRYRLTKKATKRELAKAVAAAYAFPAEWYALPADRLVALLEALSGVRVAATYGACRRGKETEPQ